MSRQPQELVEPGSYARLLFRFFLEISDRDADARFSHSVSVSLCLAEMPRGYGTSDGQGYYSSSLTIHENETTQ